MIQSISVNGIIHARHHPMHRESGACQRSARSRRLQNTSDGSLLISDIDKHTQHVALPEILHEAHRSRLASWIS